MKKINFKNFCFYAEGEMWQEIEEEINKSTDLLLSHGYKVFYEMPTPLAHWNEQPIWLTFKKNGEEHYTLGLFLDLDTLELQSTFFNSSINNRPMTDHLKNMYQTRVINSKDFQDNLLIPFQILQNNRLLLIL
jgi:hypothetical protein